MRRNRTHSNRGVLLVTTLVVGISLPVSGQDPDHILSITTTGCQFGPEVVASFFLDISTAPNNIAGWSWGVCHDGPVDLCNPASDPTCTDPITLGVDAAALNNGGGPDFFAPAVFPGEGWTVGAVVNLLGGSNLPIGGPYELHRARYTCAPGVSTLRYCNTLGNPVVETVVVDTATPSNTIIPMQIPVEIVSGDPDYVLGVTDSTGTKTLTAESSVLLDFPNGAGSIAGFSWGLCHSDMVDILAVEEGQGLSGLFPEINIVDVIPGSGWTTSVVFDPAGGFLPPGGPYELKRATYSLIEEGFAELRFCDRLGVTTRLLDGDLPPTPLAPVQHPGIIDVQPIPPVIFNLENQETHVGVILVEKLLASSSCESLSGWSAGICHDPSILMVNSADLGLAVKSLNGGLGPELSAVEVYEDGVASSVITSFLLQDWVPAGESIELLEISYLVLGPIGTTEITFCNTLGSPPTQNAAVCEGGRFIPFLNSAIIEIEESEFIRGDCDIDGGLTIADPIAILNVTLGVIDGVPCVDACDANDSGSLVIDDAIGVLAYLFAGGFPPPIPFPECGPDETEDILVCEVSAGCL